MARPKRILLICAFCCLLSQQSFAAALYPWRSSEDEMRFQYLSQQLRCVVCHGQSLAESNNPIATAMKAKLASWIVAGKKDQEIRALMIERYGERVSFKPGFRVANLYLWLAPLAVSMALGLLWLRRSGVITKK